HHRAVIVGERSYGKGSVQNVIQLESGTSALKLTTASYWRPSGKNIHRFPDSKEEDEWGVQPSKGFEVKLSDDERLEYYKYRRERDVVRRQGQPVKTVEAPPPDQNKKAAKEIGTLPAPPARTGDEKTEKAAKATEPFRDRVLDKALEYIRGELNKKA